MKIELLRGAGLDDGQIRVGQGGREAIAGQRGCEHFCAQGRTDVHGRCRYVEGVAGVRRHLVDRVSMAHVDSIRFWHFRIGLGFCHQA